MSPVVDTIRRFQERAWTRLPTTLPSKGKIGFAFSSKERPDLTLQAVKAMDAEGGYDLIWLDGSRSKEARNLPFDYIFQNANLVEVNPDVTGGAFAAVKYGLYELLLRGYDYVGLIENDVILEPGWFKTLMGLFDLAAADGIVAGSATVRNYRSRVMEYRSGYSLNWAMGAGMILFSRPAAEVVYHRLCQFPEFDMSSPDVDSFYRREFGVDVGRVYVDGSGVRVGEGIGFTGDWSYAPVLYKFGYASVGSIPSMATDLGFTGHGLWLLNDYVRPEDDNKGIALAEFIKCSA